MVIFYIAHLGMRYEIYSAHFLFDLRCQSGICMLRHCHECFMQYIKHEACSRDANKARGKTSALLASRPHTECFILHKAMLLLFKEFPEKCFDRNVFTN